jgi:hypothetical protein
MAGILSQIILDNHDYRGLLASRTVPLAMKSAAIWQSLPGSEPILYGDDRTARTFVDGLANVRFRVIAAKKA